MPSRDNSDQIQNQIIQLRLEATKSGGVSRVSTLLETLGNAFKEYEL